MQISAITSIQPSASVQQHGAAAQANAAKQQAATEAAANKPFQPAPQIRPNVQDYIDIDRWLLLLRQV